MAGNPKKSEWFSTPKERRKRPQIELTLSIEAREKLRRLAKKTGWSRSMVVEWLVLDRGAEAIAILNARRASDEG